MDRFDPAFVGRDIAPDATTNLLVHPRAGATAVDAEGNDIIAVTWTRHNDGWYMAWIPAHVVSGQHDWGTWLRAPQLDAADHAHLVQHIGEVLMPGCLNYGANGVLIPYSVPGQDKPKPSKADHKCNPDTDLGYEGEIGAPGYGQAWSCKVCDAPWVKVGDTFSQNDPEGGEPFNILTINDVR